MCDSQVCCVNFLYPFADKPEALAALLATGARRIVYVSCDPATLARDAATMAAAGYAAVRAVPVDMFPQTYHVETVAIFDKARG